MSVWGCRITWNWSYIWTVMSCQDGGCWELNLSSLGEELVLLTNEQSLPLCLFETKSLWSSNCPKLCTGNETLKTESHTGLCAKILHTEQMIPIFLNSRLREAKWLKKSHQWRTEPNSKQALQTLSCLLSCILCYPWSVGLEGENSKHRSLLCFFTTREVHSSNIGCYCWSLSWA